MKRNFPTLKIYQDWRTLIEGEGANIESVNVQEDHMHAQSAMSAMQIGELCTAKTAGA